AFTTAVIGIYLILVLLFNSALQPLFVMTAIPLGVIGVIAALALHGQQPSFMAMMGLIGLSGVVVNDSLVLVNHINTLRKGRPGVPMIEIVSDAASDRLRAIVLTTLTTVAGLLPLAYGVGGADPFIAPMVLVMGFGLLFASPVTLALVPSLYLVMDDAQRLGRRIFRRRAQTPGPDEGDPGSGEGGEARVIGLGGRRELERA
ncbi:MAG: efflux RND transporter permease subunit, partial [Candidatus Krumholzibacteria bacterium]|nr:efflux RND transporter permease subunit [Candidatus Krumholzibacteria bacterium]